MMGIFSEFRKSCRNRENYKEQVRKLVKESMEQAIEIAKLRRKLALISEYIDRALA